MLKDKNSAAIVAVSDIKRARDFYERTLGLDVSDDAMGEVVTYKTGDTFLTVYVSKFAGTNKANAVAWGVGDDIESIAADLALKGVTFERYDMPETTYANGIHRSGDMRMVWFKDPDGNILHLNSAS